VDRFFSKLDLRDIKIDPFRTSFPPDGDDDDAVDAAAELPAPPADDPPAANGWAHADRRPHVPAWAAPAAAVATTGEVEVETDIAIEPEAAPAVPASYEGAGEVLKVSARSRPSAVAGAIAGVVRENGRAEVQAIGAGATNQAVKAVAIARDYLRETGIEVVCLPAFIDVTIDNEDRTAIRLVVEPR
jgi:stage V sporulation protein S